MKSKELKNKDKNELLQALFDLKTKMAKFSFDLEANILKDTSQIKKVKKDVARILTALRQLKS